MFPSGLEVFCAAVVIGVMVIFGLYRHHRHFKPRAIAEKKFGEEAVLAIERAVDHWNRSCKPEDDEWCAAFTSLGEALSLAPESEIRDHMHAHSWAAIDLFCRYTTERECWDFGGVGDGMTFSS